MRPRALLIVAFGGAIGSLARHGVSDAVGTSHGFPTGTFVVNVVGALVLAVLVETIVLRRPSRGEDLRLLMGTGFLGGFTTYSALALQTDVLLRDGQPVVALLYALGTVVVGFVASVVGLAAARRAG